MACLRTAEDRWSYKKRQDKKRENIQQTKHQMRHNLQNIEQATALLWSSDLDAG